MSTILVLAETRQGELHPQSKEAVAAGQALAAHLGGDLCIAVLGKGAEAGALADASAQKLLLVRSDALEPQNADATCLAARAVVEATSPDFVFLPNTYQGRDYAPRLAASMRRGLVSDCTGLRVEDGKPIFVRTILQGKANADIATVGAGPHFISTQGSAFRADDMKTGDAPAPEVMDVDIDTSKVRTAAEAPVQGAAKSVDLTAADIIVSVGRGIEAPENIPLAEKLAAAIKGEVGASRPVCDAEWLPMERQIGSSGQTVTPKLYLALGISGSIQHMMGMKGSRSIVAINKDPHAPIFKAADYGVVGDVLEVVPALVESLEKA